MINAGSNEEALRSIFPLVIDFMHPAFIYFVFTLGNVVIPFNNTPTIPAPNTKDQLSPLIEQF